MCFLTPWEFSHHQPAGRSFQKVAGLAAVLSRACSLGIFQCYCGGNSSPSKGQAYSKASLVQNGGTPNRCLICACRSGQISSDVWWGRGPLQAEKTFCEKLDFTSPEMQTPCVQLASHGHTWSGIWMGKTGCCVALERLQSALWGHRYVGVHLCVFIN